MSDDMTSAPEAASAVDKPVAKVLGERTRTVDLEWPVEFDGKVWRQITVRRVSGEEVAEFFRAGDETRLLRMYDCPAEVIAALDADDYAAVNKAVHDFLPRAFRGSDE